MPHGGVAMLLYISCITQLKFPKSAFQQGSDLLTWCIIRHELSTLPLFCKSFGTIFFDHVIKFGMELEMQHFIVVLCFVL